MNWDQRTVDALTKATENVGFFVLWGSHLYGSHRPDSDHDFQLIIPDARVEEVRVMLSRNWNARRGDVHLHSETEYEIAFNEYKPWAVETFFAPPLFYTVGDSSFAMRRGTLNKKLLRDEFARTASNSYVKCKKKLIVHDDFNPLIAKKSMFHSLRLLDYAWQIAKTGSIKDWESCNRHFSNMLKLPNDWKTIEAEYKPVYNQLASALREACPK